MEESERSAGRAQAYLPGGGRRRVAIERVAPEIDGGRFPVKRVIGETVAVSADIFADGHDRIAPLLLFRHEGEETWRQVAMRPLPNDRWEGEFTVTELGSYYYTLSGRIDHFATWRLDLEKRLAAGTATPVDLQIGAGLLEAAACRAAGKERERLAAAAKAVRRMDAETALLSLARDGELARLMDRHPDPELTTAYGRRLEVVVERREALFSAWYELFPRSTSLSGGHGTFAECARLLPRIATMGFDVVYLPPIHPIGLTSRKGKNNAPVAEAEDPGSPWAIGSLAGGHRAIHPELGTPEEFAAFVGRARELGVEVALDLAFQCSPDHPYVREHPAWFAWRPDGTVQYAENPPKKYEDIIPFSFETAEWLSLWEELRDTVLFWVGLGITIFRVDNPHTKPFPFWEWLIREVKGRHPEAIFLSEAFTRPKVMYRLAKLGFSQSYTYFSWRNTKREVEEYLTELTGTEVREFFRPNFWPNTPDILPEVLQFGGPPAFAIRFLLAATLSASYGIYGPPFDLFVDEALDGKEEYRDSEKYEIRRWDWDDPHNLRDLITRVNRLRHAHPALQATGNLRFCPTDSDAVIAFLKTTADLSDILLVVVNLDPFTDREAEVRLPAEVLGSPPGAPLLLHDLLSGERHFWQSPANRLFLANRQIPGKIYQVRPRLRRENDFDYFL